MEFTEAINELHKKNNKDLLKALKIISSTAFHDPNLVEEYIIDIKNTLYHEDEDICAYACWTAGQIGRNKPNWYKEEIPTLLQFLEHKNDKIRENALFALGWIGRKAPYLIESSLDKIIDKHNDVCPKVRLNMIWASENIANTKPELFKDYIAIYEKLLDDPDIKYVRGEAPEFFRVMGKHRPDIVERSIKILEKKLSDENRVTRIHSKGALKIIKKNLKK